MTFSITYDLLIILRLLQYSTSQILCIHFSFQKKILFNVIFTIVTLLKTNRFNATHPSLFSALFNFFSFINHSVEVSCFTLIFLTTRHDITRHHTTSHDITRHHTTRHNIIQHNTTQHNTTQHNTTQHNTTQHNTIRHNTTRHNQYAVY